MKTLLILAYPGPIPIHPKFNDQENWGSNVSGVGRQGPE